MSAAHILVVDDYAVSRRLLQEILRRGGYTSTPAANGLEAIEKIDTQVFDLVLLDIDMPYMNGLQVLKHLRATERYRELPIVMLTASAEASMREEIGKAGASAFLNKPTSSAELIATVKALLK